MHSVSVTGPIGFGGDKDLGSRVVLPQRTKMENNPFIGIRRKKVTLPICLYFITGTTRKLRTPNQSLQTETVRTSQTSLNT